MSEFLLPGIKGQAIAKIVPAVQVSGVSGNYLLKLVPGVQVSHFTGNYLRDARILDMSKPLHVGDVKGQVIGTVTVEAKLTEVVALVLQSKDEREIPEAPGGLFQKRIY